jgi:hypothetical protein
MDACNPRQFRNEAGPPPPDQREAFRRLLETSEPAAPCRLDDLPRSTSSVEGLLLWARREGVFSLVWQLLTEAVPPSDRSGAAEVLYRGPMARRARERRARLAATLEILEDPVIAAALTECVLLKGAAMLLLEQRWVRDVSDIDLVLPHMEDAASSLAFLTSRGFSPIAGRGAYRNARQPEGFLHCELARSRAGNRAVIEVNCPWPRLCFETMPCLLRRPLLEASRKRRVREAVWRVPSFADMILMLCATVCMNGRLRIRDSLDLCVLLSEISTDGELSRVSHLVRHFGLHTYWALILQRHQDCWEGPITTAVPCTPGERIAMRLAATYPGKVVVGNFPLQFLAMLHNERRRLPLCVVIWIGVLHLMDRLLPRLSRPLRDWIMDRLWRMARLSSPSRNRAQPRSRGAPNCRRPACIVP